MTITTEAALVYRDKQDGVRWNPKKSEIRDLFGMVDSTTARIDLTNVSLTAVPAIAGVNAEASITDAEDPILNVAEYYAEIDFGNGVDGWKSVSLNLIENTFKHAGQTQAGVTYVSRSVGSGANGPANASFAVGGISFKEDWKTSLVSGEVDVFYLNMRQGLSSDGGGILNSAQKVFALADAVADYTADGVQDEFETAGVIPVTIPASVVDWPVAVYLTDDTGKHRLFSGVELTRDGGTGVGLVTFDTPPVVLETNLTANGSASSFTTDFAVPGSLLDNLTVTVNSVLQTKKANNDPSSPGAGYTVATSASTGFVTVTFYNTSGVLAPPSNGLSVDLELAPVIEIYDTIRRTLFTANGSQSAFTTGFAIPASISTPTVGEVVVFVNNVRQNKKLNNLPASTGAGYTVARNTTTGLATVTFYDTSGTLAPPTASQEVRLELAYDGGVTTNEYNAIELVTWGVGTDQQITHIRKKTQGISPFVEGYDGYRTYTHGHYIEAQVGENFSGVTFGAADGSFGTAGGSPYFDWLAFAQSARAVAPEPRVKYQTFGITGNGTKILMGAEGSNRKFISADAGSLKIRNSTDTATLCEFQEDGDVVSANNVLVGGGFVVPQQTFTASFLNAAVAEWPLGTAVVCSNARGGKSGWVERTEDGWRIMGTTTAIPA